MTDISITAANVVKGTGAAVRAGTAGATITAGQVVYEDSTTATFKLADADGAAALRSPVGIALNSASSGQPIDILTSGLITIGGTLSAGTTYYLSKVAGGIAPVADIASGGYATVLGIATSASVLKVSIIESGVAL